jgi:hypothetical protein
MSAAIYCVRQWRNVELPTDVLAVSSMLSLDCDTFFQPSIGWQYTVDPPQSPHDPVSPSEVMPDSSSRPSSIRTKLRLRRPTGINASRSPRPRKNNSSRISNTSETMQRSKDVGKPSAVSPNSVLMVHTAKKYDESACGSGPGSMNKVMKIANTAATTKSSTAVSTIKGFRLSSTIKRPMRPRGKYFYRVTPGNGFRPEPSTDGQTSP